jgi:hypothetical protein
MTDTVTDPEERVHLLDSIKELEHQRDHAQATHRAEIAIITERLIDAAEQNEMCETYDAVIDALNKHLTVPLGVRDRDQTLRVEGTITFTFSRYLDVPLPYNANIESDDSLGRVRSQLRAVGLRFLDAQVDEFDIVVDNVEYE